MRKVCLLAGAAFVALSVATPAMSETLEEVLATAYNTNPTLEAGRAQLRATDENVPQALSGWRPTVTLNGQYGVGRFESNASSPRSQDRNPASGSLTVQQAIYRGGRTVAAVDQAEAGVLAERASLRATEQQVLLDAATAHLNVVRDVAVLELNRNNEQVLRRQLEAAQERFRVGEITRTDVSQSEARLARATADRVAAEGNLQASRATFINVIGRAPENPKAPAITPDLPTNFEDVTRQALEANPQVVAADWAVVAAREGISLAEGELLPTVTVEGQYSRGHDVSSRLSGDRRYRNEEATATLNVNVPLYEGGAAYSRVRAQKHTWGQRRVEADQARRDTLENATRAWENLLSARAQSESYTAQIRAAQLALDGVSEEAKVGSRTVLDVLDAEQELFDAKVALVGAQRDAMVAAYALKASVGQLTAEGLALPVDVYDPRQHYGDVRNKFIGWGIEDVPAYNR